MYLKRKTQINVFEVTKRKKKIKLHKKVISLPYQMILFRFDSVPIKNGQMGINKINGIIIIIFHVNLFIYLVLISFCFPIL